LTTKSGGTGVGLAVVRKIMERHGGRVTLEPSAGRGARFVLELPAASL
jgi:signal transduction histidine kinase